MGSRGKALVGSLGDKAPEAEAKCEINVQFLTEQSLDSIFANTQFKKISEDSMGRLNLLAPPSGYASDSNHCH